MERPTCSTGWYASSQWSLTVGGVAGAERNPEFADGDPSAHRCIRREQLERRKAVPARVSCTEVGEVQLFHFVAPENIGQPVQFLSPIEVAVDKPALRGACHSIR